MKIKEKESKIQPKLPYYPHLKKYLQENQHEETLRKKISSLLKHYPNNIEQNTKQSKEKRIPKYKECKKNSSLFCNILGHSYTTKRVEHRVWQYVWEDKEPDYGIIFQDNPIVHIVCICDVCGFTYEEIFPDTTPLVVEWD